MMDPETRSSNADEDRARAHQPDGTDSSDEFDARIADENMIPERTPE